MQKKLDEMAKRNDHLDKTLKDERTEIAAEHKKMGKEREGMALERYNIRMDKARNKEDSKLLEKQKEELEEKERLEKERKKKEEKERK